MFLSFHIAYFSLCMRIEINQTNDYRVEFQAPPNRQRKAVIDSLLTTARINSHTVLQATFSNGESLVMNLPTNSDEFDAKKNELIAERSSRDTSSADWNEKSLVTKA